MDIAETKEGIDQDIRAWTNALKFNGSPIVQLGTSSFKAQRYFSDYDLFSRLIIVELPHKNHARKLTKSLKD